MEIEVKPGKSVLTDQELEIMKIVWSRGSSTVREVYEELLKHRKIAYTTVMTMMGILEQKGRLRKSEQARAFVQQFRQQVGIAVEQREIHRTLQGAVDDHPAPLCLNYTGTAKRQEQSGKARD
jgi:predicted transcriptional regulator